MALKPLIAGMSQDSGGSTDFNNISVTGGATWAFSAGLDIQVDGALTAVGGTTALFGTINYGFYITEATGVILKTGRIRQNVTSAADDATAVIDCTTTDIYELTAMANATTFSVTGTPLNGQTLLVRLKDNGTARALTWGSEFVAAGQTMPTTTVLGKKHHVGFIYDAASSKWECVMALVQA